MSKSEQMKVDKEMYSGFKTEDIKNELFSKWDVAILNNIPFTDESVQTNNPLSKDSVSSDKKVQLYGETVNIKEINLNVLDIDKS